MEDQIRRPSRSCSLAGIPRRACRSPSTRRPPLLHLHRQPGGRTCEAPAYRLRCIRCLAGCRSNAVPGAFGPESYIKREPETSGSYKKLDMQRRSIVRLKLLRVWGLMALTAVGIYAMPPTTGAQYWSTDPNLNCSAFHALISEIQLASGGKGYACFVSGTFAWLAAGGSWSSSIRIDAPASGAIGVDLGFFQDGQRFSMDTISGNGSVPTSSNLVSLALSANQPS